MRNYFKIFISLLLSALIAFGTSLPAYALEEQSADTSNVSEIQTVEYYTDDKINENTDNAEKKVEEVDKITEGEEIIESGAISAYETPQQVLEDGDVTLLKFDIPTVNLAYNESYGLVVRDQNNEKVTTGVTYSSSNSSVATISSNGTVTGKGKKGSCTITAKYANGVTTTCKVNVAQPCDYLYLNIISANINIGTWQFNVDYQLKGGSSRNVIFTSSNPDVVEVDPNGILTGVSYGESTITATTFNGKTASCKITVSDEEKSVRYTPTSLKFDIPTVNLAYNESYGLVVRDQNNEKVTTGVTYSSSNSSIATISSNGTVTGKGKKGSCTITAKYANGVTTTCKVNVAQPCDYLYLNIISANINIGTWQFNVDYQLKGGSSRNVIFTSSNPDVVEVDPNGILTGVSYGESTITATTFNGKTASCKVTVSDEPKSVVYTPTSLKFDIPTVNLAYNESYGLVVRDQNNEKVTTGVTYSSSNTSIATISSNGTVTGKGKNGSCTITAKYPNGVTTTCKVNVGKACDYLYLNIISANINIGDWQFNVDYQLKGGASRNVIFTSSNPDVVEVDPNGILTGVSYGESTITATTFNGKTASCKITVSDEEKSVRYTPTSLKFDIPTVNLAYNESYGLVVRDQNNEKVTTGVTYSSSNTSVATISSNGTVTGKGKKGSCTITAKYANGVTTTCKVNVAQPCDYLYLNIISANINIGTWQFNVDYQLKGGSSRNVIFTSSNPDVVEVDPNGILTGVSYGESTITATTFNGKTASCKITVSDEEKSVRYTPTSLKFDIPTVNLAYNESYGLVVRDQNNDKVTTGVTYSSSNTSIATISSNGTVTGKGRKGSCTITAKYANGVTTTCKVNVAQPCTSVTLNVSNVTIGVGENDLNIDYQLYGGSSRNIKFTSSNTSIATVNEYGIVTGKKTGTVTITCVTFNNKKATCKVTVKAAPTSLTITNSNSKIQLGYNNYVVNYKLGSNQGSYNTTFKSSNTSVATINSSGKITPKKVGKTTITVTTYNGKKDTITISVVNENNCLPLNKLATQMSYDYSHVTKYVYGKSTQGRNLEAFIITPANGKYSKTYVITFAIHGFEDSYSRDGQVLTEEANKLVEYYAKNPSKLQNYRLVVIPCLNPDGTIAGKNNYRESSSAFGRCTAAHIDMNRDFTSFKAVETRALRDFLKKYQPDLFTDFHGWMNTTIGNTNMISIFNKNLGLSGKTPNQYNRTYLYGYVKNTYNCPSALVEYRSPSSVNHTKTYTAINSIINAY